MLKVVNCCCKTLHLKCLQRSWLHLFITFILSAIQSPEAVKSIRGVFRILSNIYYEASNIFKHQTSIIVWQDPKIRFCKLFLWNSILNISENIQENVWNGDFKVICTLQYRYLPGNFRENSKGLNDCFWMSWRIFILVTSMY